MGLRLEVGNVYKDRVGRLHKIIALTGDSTYPFVGVSVTSSGKIDATFPSSFEASGHYDVRGISGDYDLVQLVQTTTELSRVMAELEDTKKQLKDLQGAVRSALERNV